MKITWKGKGLNEKAYDNNNNVIIECSRKYFRPTEVETLLGNAAKARRILKWKPRVQIKDLVKEMVNTQIDKMLLKHDQKKMIKFF